MTDYSLAGFSSFGSEFTTPPGEWHSDHCKNNSAFMCSSLILTSHLPLTYLSLTFHSDCSLSCPTPFPSEPDDGNIAAIAGGIIVAIVLVVVIGIVIVIVVVM